MQRKSFGWIVLFVLALGLILITPSVVSSQGMMHHGMRGNGDMQTIHQLFAYHNLVDRTVEEIPGGIRAVTESDNPQVTALIQTHVPKMYQRVSRGQWFPMINMVPSLPTMFDNANRYERQFQMTPKGIAVTETSKDADMVAVIREHARDVTRFVEEGMPAMMGKMMR
ncbi:hypothetical protein VB735_26335 [Halotia wernerae UHCC 0503]|nr:hypothetical protein [Halotia wernerae UHCC 0503]